MSLKGAGIGIDAVLHGRGDSVATAVQLVARIRAFRLPETAFSVACASRAGRRPGEERA